MLQFEQELLKQYTPLEAQAILMMNHLRRENPKASMKNIQKEIRKHYSHKVLKELFQKLQIAKLAHDR